MSRDPRALRGADWQGGKAAGIDQHAGGWALEVALTTGQGEGKQRLQLPSSHQAFTYTVQFLVEPPTGGAFPGLFSATATIKWVIEGQAIFRKVDVGNGVSVSGVSIGCEVIITDNTPERTSETGTSLGQAYKVVVLVAPGVRPTQPFPPTLRAAVPTLLAPGANLTVTIPKDIGARSVQVLSSSDVFAVVPDIRVVASISGTIEADWDRSISGNFVPLPPNATEVVITNNDPANDVRVTPIWGIDG